MGKSKKTRWRTFSIDGSKDETQIINGGDVRVNGTTDLISSINSQKYSQILGDHHTNYLPHHKHSSSSSTSAAAAHHNSFKTRSYNKENYYNQRTAAKNNLASKNSWQRSSVSAFRATAASLRDSGSNNKSEEDGKTELSDSDKQDCPSHTTTTAEPIKFNEDEYTRITTPRQDVLFKKGYLSRMNSNKTANNTSTVDSTGPNSIATTTNSDPESSLSVSTLSPSTTPSMDYGQMDSQDFTASAPVYYPGYYDESGMLVFPMYNGYNYYPPNGSTSPVYLMPYPYQYDPFFMAPNTEVSATDNTEEQQQQSPSPPPQQNGDVESDAGDDKIEKCEHDGAKENNQSAEGEQNGDRMSSHSSVTEDAVADEAKKDEHDDATADAAADDDEKDVKQEKSEVTLNELSEQTPKQCFPIYANELGYVYPYANGFYNGFYYYNGMPSTSRPPKGKRRKRYSSSRSSQSHPPPPRSTAETTTDYSDDDGNNSTHNRRYYSRYSHNNHHHGWNYHNGHHHHHHHHHNSNGYNQYHYNAKYHQKNHADQNANQETATATDGSARQHESNLNANVGEFYPRVFSNENGQQKQQSPVPKELPESKKCDVSVNDLENQLKGAAAAKTNSDAPVKSINTYTTTKPSHASKSVMGRVTKKDIMDGIKLMEQQNINLKATSKAQLKAASTSTETDVEWNVIKKGKKVKIVKDSQSDAVTTTTSSTKSEPLAVEIITKNSVEDRPRDVATVPLSQELVSNKKTTTTTSATQASVTNNFISTNNNAKSKKSKSKSKKKKPFAMIKQDGFEIIEPDFSVNNDKESEEITNEASEEEDDGATTVVEDEGEEIMSEIITDNNAIECEQKEISKKPDHNDAVIVVVERQLLVEDELKEKQSDVEKRLLSDEIKVQEEEEKVLKVFNVDLSQQKPKVVQDADDAIIDISDEEICRKTSIEIVLSIAQEIAEIEPISEPQQEELIVTDETQTETKIEAAAAVAEEEQVFEDSQYFSDRKNIAELERDLVENLKILDDGIDIKSPVINPLYDFPITSAVRKWLQERQHESFENLFRVENFKKLSELYDECDDDDDDESDISDSPQKSETTDSDYASDIQVKLNGSPASSNAKLDTKLTSKCNNKLIVKESFCALM